ncbi:MAG: hypothetical protein JWR07_94 [Nevskia sp.]|nr:hypothetical protein [Nevskia sp.]
MSKSIKHNATIVAAPTTGSPRTPRPGNGKPDPDKKEPTAPPPDKSVVETPLRAAKGDDDLMSKEQERPVRRRG